MSTHTIHDESPAAVSLGLIRDFELRRGDLRVEVAPSSQRLIAFLALQGRAVRRAYVSGTLWPDSTESRAAANLRSALWRIPASARDSVVGASTTHVWLRPGVEVDLAATEAKALTVLDRGVTDLRPVDVARKLVAFGDDILAGWYDDWVTMERERFRQLRLHALDRLGEVLLAGHHHSDALQVGLALVGAEPLRESAHRLLVRTHLAEGNVSEAIRQYRSYADLLARELDARPSAAMEELVRAYGRPRPRTAGPVRMPATAARTTVPASRRPAPSEHAAVTRW